MNDSANQPAWERLREEKSLLQETVQEALRLARGFGATAAEADAYFDEGLGVTVRLGEVETVEHTRDKGLSVTVYHGLRKGSANCGDLNPITVRETVERACTIAKYTQEDPYCGLADAELMATQFPDLDLCHPVAITPDQAIERALICEQAGRDSDPRITNSEGASVSRGASVSAYGNSHGFLASDWGTRYNQGAAFIAGADDAMQRDYWWDANRLLERLQDPAETGRIAARRTLDRLGAKQVPTATVPILLSPKIAASVIGNLVMAVAGGSLYRRSSFLLDQLGEQLFPEWLNIIEKPLLPRASNSSAYDAEGVATSNRPLIDHGRLSRYVLGSYSARRLEMKSTGNAGGVRNLCVMPGTASRDDLIRQMGRGLLVEELLGQGVNPVTGDYSRGAAGFWVENGEIVHPVQEVTIAGNLKDMYQTIQALGNDLDERSNIQSPSMLIDRMMVAGS